jgi:hypothetical protein
MSTGQTIQLVLQALVFLAWAGLMFRTIVLFYNRAVEDGAQSVPGPGQMLRQAGRWMRAPEDRSERNTLFFLTFVLLVMSLSSVFLGAPAG